MARRYANKSGRRAGGTVRRASGRGGSGSRRTGNRGVRRGASRTGTRRARVSTRPQTVRIEVVYRDAGEVARPQGVVEERKGSKPKL